MNLIWITVRTGESTHLIAIDEFAWGSRWLRCEETSRRIPRLAARAGARSATSTATSSRWNGCRQLVSLRLH